MQLLPAFHQRQDMKIGEHEQLRKIVRNAEEAIAPQVGKANEKSETAQCMERFARRVTHVGMQLRVKRHVGRERGDDLEQRAILAEPSGVRIHHLVNLEERVLWNVSPPRMRYDEAALDVACRAASELDAIAALANACQSRRTTAQRLLRVTSKDQELLC